MKYEIYFTPINQSSYVIHPHHVINGPKVIKSYVKGSDETNYSSNCFSPAPCNLTNHMLKKKLSLMNNSKLKRMHTLKPSEKSKQPLMGQVYNPNGANITPEWRKYTTQMTIL